MRFQFVIHPIDTRQYDSRAQERFFRDWYVTKLRFMRPLKIVDTENRAFTRRTQRRDRAFIARNVSVTGLPTALFEFKRSRKIQPRHESGKI